MSHFIGRHTIILNISGVNQCWKFYAGVCATLKVANNLLAGFVQKIRVTKYVILPFFVNNKSLMFSGIILFFFFENKNKQK